MPNREPRAKPSVKAAKPLNVATGDSPSTRRRAAHEPLDDINRAIITELQKDGRRSYTAIADRVGLSEAAVRQRVQRLTDDGVMQVVAVTDPMRLGFRRVAMLAMRTVGDSTELAEKLSRIPEVSYVVLAGGTYDLLAELVCEDDDHLIDVINKTIRQFPGIRETETFMYLRLFKESYTWGVPTQ
jgi:Lrp/AsnC family transcriptional regulator, regulator for asnA, asnC and gidA